MAAPLLSPIRTLESKREGSSARRPSCSSPTRLYSGISPTTGDAAAHSCGRIQSQSCVPHCAVDRQSGCSGPIFTSTRAGGTHRDVSRRRLASSGGQADLRRSVCERVRRRGIRRGCKRGLCRGASGAPAAQSAAGIAGARRGETNGVSENPFRHGKPLIYVSTLDRPEREAQP